MDTLNMFVIRRKYDSMFVGSGNHGWTKSILRARCFKNKGAAKNCRSWHEFKSFLTEHACSNCKNSRSGYWSHTYEQDKPSTRYYGETIEQWSVRNHRAPCFIRRRLTSEENPLEIIPITLSIQLG